VHAESTHRAKLETTPIVRSAHKDHFGE